MARVETKSDGLRAKVGAAWTHLPKPFDLHVSLIWPFCSRFQKVNTLLPGPLGKRVECEGKIRRVLLGHVGAWVSMMGVYVFLTPRYMERSRVSQIVQGLSGLWDVCDTFLRTFPMAAGF